MGSGNFLILFFSAIWRGVNGLRKVLHLVLLLFIFMLFFGVMSGEAPPILPHKAALVVQPVGALVEQVSGDPYERAIAELMGDAQPQTLVQDVVDALDAARHDSRIAAVHLELSALSSAVMPPSASLPRASGVAPSTWMVMSRSWRSSSMVPQVCRTPSKRIPTRLLMSSTSSSS